MGACLCLCELSLLLLASVTLAMCSAIIWCARRFGSADGRLRFAGFLTRFGIPHDATAPDCIPILFYAKEPTTKGSRNALAQVSFCY